MVDIDQWIRDPGLGLVIDDVCTVRTIHKRKLKTEATKSSVPLISVSWAQKGFSVLMATLKAFAGALSTCGHCQCARGHIH